MEKLIDVMNRKNFNTKEKESIIDLFDHVSFENTKNVSEVFIKFINESSENIEAIQKCIDYLYKMYGGMTVRKKLLLLFKERKYDSKLREKIMSSFFDIPFEEKENFAKLIFSIVENGSDVSSVLQKIAEEKENFKKTDSKIANEKIMKVYYMDDLQIDLDKHNDYVFIPNPCYYTSLGVYLVLQTEKHYIIIGIDKIEITDDISKYLGKYKLFDTVDYDEDDCYEEDIYLLFAGEKLLSYKTGIKYHALKFENFTFYVYPYKAGTVYGERVEYPLTCFDRLLTRKCSCGGKAELMISDIGNDYFIRCNKCHTSTYVGWPLRDVIDAWNNNETPINIDLDSETFLNDVQFGINYIALSDSKFNQIDDKIKVCEYVIVSTCNGKYIIRSCIVRKLKESFYISKFHELNNEHASEKIVSTRQIPIVFSEKTPFDISFGCGCKKIEIFASHDGDDFLMISVQ